MREIVNDPDSSFDVTKVSDEVLIMLGKSIEYELNQRRKVCGNDSGENCSCGATQELPLSISCFTSEESSIVAAHVTQEDGGQWQVQLTELYRLLLDELKIIRAKQEELTLLNSEKDSIIRDLHKDIQKYKEGLGKEFLLPLIMELVSWGDKIRQTVTFYYQEFNEEEFSSKFEQLREEFRKMEHQISDILYNFDVETFCAEIGTEYNPKRQHALKAIETDEPANDKCICETIHPGYENGSGRVLRKEIVYVYKFIKQ